MNTNIICNMNLWSGNINAIIIMQDILDDILDDTAFDDITSVAELTKFIKNYKQNKRH